LPEREIQEFGIRTAVAGPGQVRINLRVPGEIRLNENSTAHVAPRFAGVTKAIFKRLGDPVRAGEMLASMEANETLRPFNLTSPIDGTIIDFHMTLGETLEAGQYAYIVANTSTVWADLKIYQHDLPVIGIGQEVHIDVGKNFPPASGTITYIGPTVDETTRTGLARVVLENPGRLLRPGMFITGNILVRETTHPVVIPLSALHFLHGKPIVYTVLPDGDEFAARKVVTGEMDGQSAAILSGLQAGEVYVSDGGFHIKAESLKASFGDGHDH